MGKVAFGIFGIVLVGALVYTGWFLYEKSVEPPVEFKTEQPFVADIVKKTVAAGSIVPRKELEIKSKVSGIVDEVFVEPGEDVKHGETIARIKVIPDMSSLSTAQARIDRAEIQLEDANRQFSRQKELLEKKVISVSEFEVFDLSKKQAEQELASAEENLQIIREGVAKSSGATNNTLVRATGEGMVLDVPIEKGSFVIESNTFNEGTTIASLANMSELIFEGNVDESEVGKLKEGMPLRINIGAIEGVQFEGELEYISPKGVEDQGAIQFEIKADVALKEEYFIRAGYSANADIVLESVDSVLAINESLLLFEEQKPYVEVETSDQVFEKREIETGLSDGIKVEIKSGLSESDKIKVVENYGKVVRN